MNTPASAVVPSREAVEQMGAFLREKLFGIVADDLLALLAEVERLNTHAERLSRINREVLAEGELLSATVADQAAALAERDKDAERYRWLRHQSGHVWNHLVTERWLAKRSGAMDLSIDAALAASVSSASEEETK